MVDWIKKTQWSITSSPALTDVRLLFSGPVPPARGSGAPPLRCLLTPRFGFCSPGSLWSPLGQHFLHQTVCLFVCLPCWMGHSEARNRPSSSDSQGRPRSWWQGLPANICKMSKFTAASPFSPPPRGLFPVDPSRDRCTHVPTPSPQYFLLPAVRPISTSAHQARRASAGGAAQLKSWFSKLFTTSDAPDARSAPVRSGPCLSCWGTATDLLPLTAQRVYTQQRPTLKSSCFYWKPPFTQQGSDDIPLTMS